MLVSLVLWLRVTLAAVLIGTSTVLHVLPLFAVALVKAALPFDTVRRLCNPLLSGIAESWIGFNSRMIGLFTHTRIIVSGNVALHRDGHYLVLANHQSWVDIPVLQKVFNRRIPLLRFFLKSQLFWIPLLGLAWWALDFPFMKRYTRDQVAKRPELAGRDIAATRRACEKFRAIPVAVMNFMEGTRFTRAKHAAQKSPHRFLLRPKAGGIAFVLDAMGEGLQSILDVTVAYPEGSPSFADLFGDRIGSVHVEIRQRPIPVEFTNGGYQSDAAFRKRFREWVNEVWTEKDTAIARLMGSESD
ncbi:MAG: acyltransferase [Dokdonella sp.]